MEVLVSDLWMLLLLLAFAALSLGFVRFCQVLMHSDRDPLSLG